MTTENPIALATFTALEIVLGIDNIVFIAILTGHVDRKIQHKIRQIGLLMAMAMRILLFFAITWIMGLQSTLFSIMGNEVSGRDMVLTIGGGFLITKATMEIHHKLEGSDEAKAAGKGYASVRSVLMQIIMIDIVFSLDSVITAVGMACSIAVMITAVVISVMVMMLFATPISLFVEKHPSMKVLALSFLLMIGVLLLADGFGQHLPRGYIYFAMAFSLAVEILNLRIGLRQKLTPLSNATTDIKP